MVKVTINADSYNNGMVTRKCPHCGEEKSIDDFGYRNMGMIILEINLGVRSVGNELTKIYFFFI